jgi:hypothetical protein
LYFGLLRHLLWQKFTVVSEVLAAFIKMAIALMTTAAGTSETSVKFYQTTRRNKPGDSHLHTLCREDLKFHAI